MRALIRFALFFVGGLMLVGTASTLFALCIAAGVMLFGEIGAIVGWLVFAGLVFGAIGWGTA